MVEKECFGKKWKERVCSLVTLACLHHETLLPYFHINKKTSIANILQLQVFQKGRFDSPYIWNVLTKWPGKKIIAYFMSVKNHSAVVSLIQRQLRQAGQDSMIFFLPQKVTLPMTSLIPSPRHPNSLTSSQYNVTVAIDNFNEHGPGFLWYHPTLLGSRRAVFKVKAEFK